MLWKAQAKKKRFLRRDFSPRSLQIKTQEKEQKSSFEKLSFSE